MIFLLDIILIINIYITYKYFKNIISPPFLLGSGMLAAALIATSYYEEWEMYTFSLQSVWLIGGGCCFFTISCIFFSKIYPSIQPTNQAIFNLKFNINRLRLFYIITILIGIFAIILKLHYMKAYFGPLSFAELIIARRMDQWTGENSLKIPSLVQQMGSYTSVTSYFTIWLYSIIIIFKNYSLNKMKRIILIHLFISFVNGMLSGSKAPMLELIVIFVIIYFYNYYAQMGKYHINKKIFKRLIFAIILLAISFKGINLLIGRNVNDRTNIDLLSEYCGAQIKNFDIYLSSNSQKTSKSKVWGENTFIYYYTDINPKKFSVDNGEFQFINNYSLGNVYTLFQPYHQDFGSAGVFIIPFFIACISMFFYTKSTFSFKEPTKINANLIIYSSMAMSIFMGFFSSRFTESICRPGGIKTIIYIYILIWIINHFFIIKQHNSNNEH